MLSAMLWGAAIGAVVAIPVAYLTVRARQRTVRDEITLLGFEVVALRPDWLHVGTDAKFHVSLRKDGHVTEHTARIGVDKRVTWAPPPL